MTPDLKQLQELLAQATPNGWRSEPFGNSWAVMDKNGRVAYIYGAFENRTPEEAQAYADLMVAAVNALAALLASHEALSARVKELEGMLSGGGKDE